jgi:hypothetical protein
MRAWLILTSAALYWLLFMAVHESGHALAAVLTGGRVAHVVLHPLAISRTDVSPNPLPLVVCWAGPLWGAIVPVGVWYLWHAVRVRGEAWMQGFAGFCLIANGLYLTSSAVAPAGDTEDLLRFGVQLWVLPVLGVPMWVAGFWIWHRLGPAFGTASLSTRSLQRAAIFSTVALAAAVLVMLLVGSTTR